MGINRSRTAAACLKNGSNETDFAGTDPESDAFITNFNIPDYDLIIFMEDSHLQETKALFPGFSSSYAVFGIPDEYSFMDDSLVHRLRSVYSKFDPFYE